MRDGQTLALVSFFLPSYPYPSVEDSLSSGNSIQLPLYKKMYKKRKGPAQLHMQSASFCFLVMHCINAFLHSYIRVHPHSKFRANHEHISAMFSLFSLSVNLFLYDVPIYPRSTFTPFPLSTN